MPFSKVQCYAGDRCSATVGNSSDPNSDTFVAQGPFQCGTCPTVNGMQTAPTQVPRLASRCPSCRIQKDSKGAKDSRERRAQSLISCLLRTGVNVCHALWMMLGRKQAWWWGSYFSKMLWSPRFTRNVLTCNVYPYVRQRNSNVITVSSYGPGPYTIRSV